VSAPPETELEANAALMTRLLNYLGDAGLERLAEEADSFIHPEIEWYPGVISHGKSVYRGREEYLSYLEEAARQSGSGGYLNVREIRPLGGDRVLALAWVHHQSKDGATFDSEYALLARMQEGLVRELRSFASLAEGERAAADA
jgi:ketosteroid isomerase-like protein